jgi:hypothetical protein
MLRLQEQRDSDLLSKLIEKRLHPSHKKQVVDHCDDLCIPVRTRAHGRQLNTIGLGKF